MIQPYLTQLKEIAETTGWELQDACIDAGIARTTYYRWMSGKMNPRQEQAEKVANYMLGYARQG